MWPQINTPSGGRLTERDLDKSIALHRGVARWDGKACPPCMQNCDQGAECPHRQPRAAEAATDQGAEAPKKRPHPLLTPRTGLVLVVLTGMPLLAVIVTALIAWLPAW